MTESSGTWSDTPPANPTPEPAGSSEKDGERTNQVALPAPLDWEKLLLPVDFADNLLGNRFLERGQGFILFGPSGCGKSVAGFQAAADWSSGMDGLHIAPSRPLKIVLLQTEDSENDYRETIAGILASSLFTPEKVSLLRQNLIVLPPVAGGTSRDLALLLEAAAIEHKPDIVYVNPLQAFCSGDPARELGGLLYQVVDPIIKRFRIGFMAVHHTPKTINRDTSGFGAHDHQYLAAGDARVANWPRGMIQIEPVAQGVYLFRATKRAQRTGWTWEQRPTDQRYFRHSRTEIRWLDAAPEAVTAAKEIASYTRILEVLPASGAEGISRERLRDLAKKRLDIGKDRADSWLKLAKEDRLAEEYFTLSPNNRKVALFRKTATNGHPK